MTFTPASTLDAVRAVYSGAEGELWELLMGQQIHIGGFRSSMELAERAGIGPGSTGVDLCCCNGAGMRFLVRFRKVASMVGVDATPAVVARGTERCESEGLSARVRLVCGDACATGLPDGTADFVWGEDAWCYVEDKARLIAEAARLARPGGRLAFTDWIAGPTPMSIEESARFLRFMRFPNVSSLGGYREMLERAGCIVELAEDTGRFVEYVDLYLAMVDRQLTYDALRILDFDTDALAVLAGEMRFMRELAAAGKLIQGRFVARRR
jgi:SAM-dependent methyltransferase